LGGIPVARDGEVVGRRVQERIVLAAIGAIAVQQGNYIVEERVYCLNDVRKESIASGSGSGNSTNKRHDNSLSKPRLGSKYRERRATCLDDRVSISINARSIT